MKALLKKEFYLVGKQVVYSTLILAAILVGFTLAKQDIRSFPSALAGLGVGVTISSFSYDEMGKFLNYGLSVPYSKKSIILSKFVFSYGLVVGLYFVGIGLTLLVDKNNYLNLQRLLEVGVRVIFILSTGLSILIPAIFQFGVSKIAYSILAAMVGAVGSTLLLSIIEIPLPFNNKATLIPIIVLFLIISEIIVSYNLSLRILYKR